MKFIRNKRKRLFVVLGILNGSVLAAAFTILSEAKSALIKMICQHIPLPSWMIEVGLLLAINIACILIWLLVQYVQERRGQPDDAIMKIAIDNAGRSNRIGDFQLLRESANEDILIMGIGMSVVSEDDSITELLKKGKNVKFLIMDPDVLIKPAEPDLNRLSEQFGKSGILIDNQKFSDFYSKADYQGIITASLQKLKKFVDDQNNRFANRDKEKPWREGKIIIKKYSFYVPMNVTICDMGTSDSKLVAEFCLPFSTQRIRTKLSEGEIKSLIETQINQLWKKAHLVFCSEWITDTSNL